MAFMKFSKGKALLSVPNGLGDGSAFFDGSMYAQIANIDSLPYGGVPRSFSIWIYPTYLNNNSQHYLFAYGSSSSANLNIKIVYGSRISFGGWNYDYPFQINNWYHIVVTYDENKEFKIYCNNELVANRQNWSTDTPKGFAFIGGWYSDSLSYPFYGNLSNLQVFNRALSADEVTTLYNKSKVTDGLVLEVPLQYGKDDDSIFSSKNFVYDYSVIETSSGFDEWGYPIRYDIASECGISYGQIRIVTPVNPTSNTWEDWVMSASSEIDSLRQAYKAFTEGNDDTGTSNCWHSTNTYPQWLQWYNTKKSSKITQYSITNRETGGRHGAHILTWELQGSNDLQTWDTLDSRNRESTQDSATETFEVAKDKQQFYKYHRIYITRSDNGYSTIGNLIALGTFK